MAENVYLPWKAIYVPESADKISGWRIENSLGDIVCQGGHSRFDQRDFPFIVETVNQQMAETN